jgi:hypothetical protein
LYSPVTEISPFSFFLSKIHNPVIEMPTIDVGGAWNTGHVLVLVWSVVGHHVIEDNGQYDFDAD